MSQSRRVPLRLGRREFLFQLGAVGLAGFLAAYFYKKGQVMKSQKQNRAPVLFIGHGSPMNAIEQNRFTETLGRLGRKIDQAHGKPTAILVVSAHWLSAGTWVTHMEKPKTIHDFSGFPKALFDVQYPAPGSPKTAELLQSLVTEPRIQADDHSWGLDHGTWSVLKHLYPLADVPVLQLSIDMSEPAQYHYELGQHLRKLRSEGVLILGSGNLVHNLREVRWPRAVGESPAPHDWAVDFDTWAREKLLTRDDQAMVQDYLRTTAGRMSVPTPDHYLPILYALGAGDPAEPLRFEYEGLEMGSISMRAFSLGL